MFKVIPYHQEKAKHVFNFRRLIKLDRQKKQTNFFTIGPQRVIISTWKDGNYNPGAFSLKSLDISYGIYGIMCEKCK